MHVRYMGKIGSIQWRNQVHFDPAIKITSPMRDTEIMGLQMCDPEDVHHLGSILARDA